MDKYHPYNLYFRKSEITHYQQLLCSVTDNIGKHTMTVRNKIVILNFIVLTFLSSCSFLQSVPKLSQQTTEWQAGNWKMVDGQYWSCTSSYNYSADSIHLILGTHLPAPTISTGPPYVPIIPNIFYFSYRMFARFDHNFFVDVKFESNYENIETDLSKIHFYKSNGKEIQVYETRKQTDWHCCSLKSDLDRVNGQTASIDTIITKKIYTFSNYTIVRFNLKINEYKIRKLTISFDENFIVNRKLKVPTIILINHRSLEMIPFVFGS